MKQENPLEWRSSNFLKEMLMRELELGWAPEYGTFYWKCKHCETFFQYARDAVEHMEKGKH